MECKTFGKTHGLYFLYAGSKTIGFTSIISNMRSLNSLFLQSKNNH